MIIYDTLDVHELSIYKYKIISNVNDYSYIDYDKWQIDIIESNIEDINTSYYWIIDTLYNNALIHRTYECAIYLLFFKELKLIYPK
jgi:hypothetical protein